MKTASQIIRAFLFSPDQHPGNGTPEFEAVCQDAREFLAMEREIQEARALVKLNQFDEAGTKIYELIDKDGLSNAVLEVAQFRNRVREAHRTLKIEALLKEALELASQSDEDFDRNNRGAERVKEIAKEAASEAYAVADAMIAARNSNPAPQPKQ